MDLLQTFDSIETFNSGTKWKNTTKREEEGLCGGPTGRIDGLACTGNENVGMQKNYFWDKIYEVFNKNNFSWVFLGMLEKQRLKIE